MSAPPQVKRAQGGSDFDLDRLVALCPPCHAQTDAPDRRARRVTSPLAPAWSVNVVAKVARTLMLSEVDPKRF